MSVREAVDDNRTKWNSVFQAYFRMCGTVVVASVARMFLDSVGIVLSGETPTGAGFWFGHCEQRGKCVLIGICEFLFAWLGSAFFVWKFQEWLVDPASNPFAQSLSWPIIIGAAEWLPMSIMVGKVNILVEYCQFSASSSFLDMIANPLITLGITFGFSTLTHYVMKHCRTVLAPGGFGQFTLLLLIYCLGFAAGWSWWTVVLALLSAFSGNEFITCSCIVLVTVLAARFYLTYGPEPILPKVGLNGPEQSLRRSIISFLVYSSMILIVQCWVDPTFGLLKRVVSRLHDFEFPRTLDLEALFIMFFLAASMTVGGAFLSFLISRNVEVDFTSSIRTSRSAAQSTFQRAQASQQANKDSVFDTGNDSISQSECFCILIYDVMSFVAACLWAYLVLGIFSVVFRRLASVHDGLYITCAFFYFVFFLILVGRVCLLWFPTRTERANQRALSQASDEEWSRMGTGLLGGIQLEARTQQPEP